MLEKHVDKMEMTPKWSHTNGKLKYTPPRRSIHTTPNTLVLLLLLYIQLQTTMLSYARFHGPQYTPPTSFLFHSIHDALVSGRLATLNIIAYQVIILRAGVCMRACVGAC